MKSKRDIALLVLAFLVVLFSWIIKPAITLPLAFASVILLGLYFLFKN